MILLQVIYGKVIDITVIFLCVATLALFFLFYATLCRIAYKIYRWAWYDDSTR